MTVTTHDISLESLDALGVEALCLFVSQEDRPLQGAAGFLDWRMCGGLSRVLQAEFFTGTLGDRLLMPCAGRIGAVRLFVLGTGPKRSLPPAALAEALTEAAKTLNRAKVESVALELPPGAEDSTRAAVLLNHFLPTFRGTKVALLAERSLARLLPASSSGSSAKPS